MFTTDEADHDTVMPFVVCRSHGGPHDDAAFASGWRLGELDAMLAQPGISSFATAVHRAERAQADLVAMARGHTMAIDGVSVDPGDQIEWLLVSFTRNPPSE